VRGVCPSVCPSDSLSGRSIRLHCAKTAEQSKMLFGVNTSRGSWNIVLDGGLDPPIQRGRGGVGGENFCQLWTLYISQEWLNLDIWNFACIQRAGGPDEKNMKLQIQRFVRSKAFLQSACCSELDRTDCHRMSWKPQLSHHSSNDSISSTDMDIKGLAY